MLCVCMSISASKEKMAVAYYGCIGVLDTFKSCGVVC
jgi:hypothetical protein